ncbi:hypothetical protein [Methanobacterium aggregans]|uniref:hypothetical protein n=1 Tax=Methanobacterium aggregans TaxID=1615586 RepID=UPI001AE9A610|nr:hypothetical protein [Methanobacterium aggregans]MBP2045388.1 hypothetical protein [Methanobacterium aggregans]
MRYLSWCQKSPTLLFYKVGRGGGTIKRKSLFALLCAIGMVLCILPATLAVNTSNTSQEPSKVTSSEVKEIKEVKKLNAASYYYKKVVKYKKVAYYKHHKKHYKYKKVVTYKRVYKTAKAASTYKTVKKVYKSVAAYNVKKTSITATATAKCSCGATGNYNYHTASFKNYCPHCHKSGVLVWNPKGTAEGEWTCSSCDADYCAADGKEKVYRSPKYLKKA